MRFFEREEKCADIIIDYRRCCEHNGSKTILCACDESVRYQRCYFAAKNIHNSFVCSVEQWLQKQKQNRRCGERVKIQIYQ